MGEEGAAASDIPSYNGDIYREVKDRGPGGHILTGPVATTLAVRDMINFLVEQKHLSRDDAYMLTSVAVDVDITQLVDGSVGVHAMCPKNIFTK
jgi:acetamidase/formamidase